MPRLMEVADLCSRTLSVTANMSRHGSTLCSPTVEKILCRSLFSKRSHIGNLRRIRKQGKGRSSKRKENRRLSFLFAHRRGYGVSPAAGAATLPPSADGESPAEVQRKPSRPERANPPAAVRAPRWVGAEKEPPRQGEHANAVRMPRSPGAEKTCRRFVHRHIKAKPRFPSVFFFICGGANRSCDRLRGAHRPDGFRCPT